MPDPPSTGTPAAPSVSPAHDALRPFDADELDELVTRVGATAYGPGSWVLRRGQDIRHIGLVVEGQLELVRRSGHRRVVLQLLHPRDVLGDIPFLTHVPAPFDVRALQPSRVVHLDVEVFWTLLTTRPHVCQRFLYSMATRMERLQRRFVELTGTDLRQRLAALLLDEDAEEAGPLRLTQAKLAEMIAASRQSVNPVLGELEAAGMIRVGYGSVEVLDRDGLRALVD